MRRIIPGGADDSYGIEVAKLAGVPQSIITRAKEILAELESGRGETVVVDKNENDEQIPLLFAEQNSPMIEKIKAADLNTLTPIEAMNLLYELKSMI